MVMLGFAAVLWLFSDPLIGLFDHDDPAFHDVIVLALSTRPSLPGSNCSMACRPSPGLYPWLEGRQDHLPGGAGLLLADWCTVGLVDGVHPGRANRRLVGLALGLACAVSLTWAFEAKMKRIRRVQDAVSDSEHCLASSARGSCGSWLACDGGVSGLIIIS